MKRKTNKLIFEKSPYLLQHAYNPVDWYPWSEEAFNLSKEKNKPIFLSIGYSTCHWCHVMEKESFEDEEIAKLMNDAFISIKVDREERPDIDNIYMTVCQMLTGRGGWPLTILMTPDQKPFFAGTYFPKSAIGNRIGMKELIPKIMELWENRYSEVHASANHIVEHLSIDINTDSKVTEEIFEKAFLSYIDRFDRTNGGFGSRPKFPSPHNILFLLRYYISTKNDLALEMVKKTLIEMRKGGIYDHIGFGFHRYSTDEKWLLPHFEKMLYDQAMHTIAYAEAYQLTKEDIFKRTAEEISEYVLRDMTSEEGGFYSAEDADSEGEEGRFYLWNYDEFISVLAEDAVFAMDYYGFEKDGNFYEESTGRKIGNNILFTPKEMEEFSAEIGMGKTLLNSKLEKIRSKLYYERRKRISPYKDDKILTDWNGLMIAALAISGRILGNDGSIDAAEKCVAFIKTALLDKNNNLKHRYRDGESSISGNLDDYAFFIWGLLELYEATFKIDYLKLSITLSIKVINEFWDHKTSAGFYFTAEHNSELIARTKEFYDGALPSGNSVMYMNLLKLIRVTEKDNFKEIADKLAAAFGGLLKEFPTNYSYFLSGLLFFFEPSNEIIILGNRNTKKTKDIVELVNNRYIPNKIFISIEESQIEDLKKIIPSLKNFKMSNNETIAYICRNFACDLPTDKLDEIEQKLDSMI